MTTPSYVPLDVDLLNVKNEPQGNLSARAVVGVTGTVGSSTVIGLIPFQKGFTLNTLNLEAVALSSGTTIVVDVGYVYDDNVTYLNDTAYFANNIDLFATGGSDFKYPSSTGSLNVARPFRAEAPGWVTITTGSAVTTTTGTVYGYGTLTYDSTA